MDSGTPPLRPGEVVAALWALLAEDAGEPESSDLGDEPMQWSAQDGDERYTLVELLDVPPIGPKSRTFLLTISSADELLAYQLMTFVWIGDLLLDFVTYEDCRGGRAAAWVDPP